MEIVLFIHKKGDVDVQKFVIKKAYDYLDRNPEENIGNLLDWAEKFIPNAKDSVQFQLVHEAIMDPDNNWRKLVISLWDDVDKEVRKKLFENFVINSFFTWADQVQGLRDKYDCNIPWAILMDPTSACNLKCKGCWAAEYGNKLNLSFEELDSIICQGKELGIYMYLFSGGEPLVRKNDIIALCNKHSDCVFLAFTNGTLIDDDFADEMLRVKNFVPAISVEGFEEATDFRRGEGTFQAIVAAMERLKERKLPFGVSSCYTRSNFESISSEEYFDWIIDMGAKFCWFFTYMPIGKNAPTDLMVTAEQRKEMYRIVREYRKTKPLFTIDFWNDGEYVEGCIAGGKNYLHINANGDVEPCAFIHYSDSNIREKTLLEALQSPLFQGYRANQPFNKNHLRPCPLLDNPGRLSAIVDQSKAKSTDVSDPEDVHQLTEKCVETASNWAPVAAGLWEEK